jgi:DNA polymerase (family 10)
MRNEEIARIFDAIGDLLELEEANPFRIRAYRRGALSLRAISGDVADISAKGALKQIEGIGEDLARKIEEYLATGKIRFYEELREKTPPVLIEMLEISGVGPKTSKLIYRKLHPKNIAHLEILARAGKIRLLPGMKEKTERNILDGIGLFKKNRERPRLGAALPQAREMVARLSKLKEAKEVSCAGSVRRMCETVHDVDILVGSGKPAVVMDHFIKMKEVWRVLAHGPTKSSVILKDGLQIDLRVVAPDSYGAALLYFTGSKAHNVKLRVMAKKRGLKINEYGIFKEKTGRRLAGRSEEDVYKVLGLAYIEPELREDEGEIEAAAKGTLPRLVKGEDFRGDFHMHSRWSDGSAEIEEMAAAAKKRGLEYAVLTDHSRSLRVANGLSPGDLRKQIQITRAYNRKSKGFTLLIGSEVDILADGSLDYPDDLLKELDFVVASVHSRFKMKRDEMTARIIRAMKNPHVKVIGHPTGRLIGSRNPYEVDFERLFKAAKETNTALEINSYPERMDLDAVHARRAAEMGVMLAVDTDAHAPDQLLNHEYGVGVARRAWCEKKNILNCLRLADLRRKIVKKPV